jgi:hypothetical protein
MPLRWRKEIIKIISILIIIINLCQNCSALSSWHNTYHNRTGLFTNTSMVGEHIELQIKGNWTNISDHFQLVPPAKCMFGFSYDNIDDVAIFFGGCNDIWSTNDTWLLTIKNETWKNMTPLNSPSMRYRTSMTFDTLNRAAVLFGGDIDDPTEIPSSDGNDTWIYNIDSNTWVNKSRICLARLYE